MGESTIGQVKMGIESITDQVKASDLISRRAAKDALDGICDRECEYSKKQRAVMCASCHLGSAFDAIDELPSIDPVKHGKWVVVKRHEHYPSGKPYEQVQCPFCKRFDNNGDGSFCGYCGAKMERSEE